MIEDYFKLDIFNHLDIKEDVKLIYGSKDISVNNKNIFKLAKIKNWDLYRLDDADHFCRRPQDVQNIAKLFIDILNKNK